jgi:hypothetical protein
MKTLALRPDPTGFPMIWVDSIGAWLHWLPVTKIQFEHFLCDAADRAFGISWYEEILRLNPRVTPSKISQANYWHALLTGIQPSEAQRFAFWCGDGYRLPTSEEWTEAYAALAAMPVVDTSDLGDGDGRSSRITELLTNLEVSSEVAAEQMGYSRGLADQMLMRLGVLEWVSARGRWGGKGEPFPGFCGSLLTPEDDTPVIPLNPENERLPAFGFRLLFNESEAGRRN